MFREGIEAGHYLLVENWKGEEQTRLIRRDWFSRNVGERTEIDLGGGARGIQVRWRREYEGMNLRTGQVSRGDMIETQDGRSFPLPLTSQGGEVDFFYKPFVPLGFFSVVPFAIMYQKALNNIQAGEEIKGIAPRINYYQMGNDDVFSIRGTQTIEDLAHDLLLGGEVFNYKSALMEKKLDIYEKFINENRRPDKKLIITGHSLGALEMSYLMERINPDETIGFAQPVFKPHSKVSVSYSYDKDPLYRSTGVSNHKILRKNIGDSDLFKDYHSIKNYY